MSFSMRWLGTACFEIILPSKKTLIIDPYLDDSVSAPIASDGIDNCDYIFITHGHYDHISGLTELRGLTRAKVAAHKADLGSTAGQVPYPWLIRRLLCLPPFSALRRFFYSVTFRK